MKKYPGKLQNRHDWFMQRKLPHKAVFILMGVMSTTWFLVRVIPKPSRAGYPCMKAAAPFMSGFILWLLSLSLSAGSLKLARAKFRKAQYLPATVLLIAALLSGSLVLLKTDRQALAGSNDAPGVDHPSNQPFGTARGIFPGRVVWKYHPEATNELCDGTTNDDGIYTEDDNAYFLKKNNNQDVIDQMLEESLTQLAGESDPAMAWNRIFRYFNRTEKQKGDVGYTEGEIIHIKTNSTSSWGDPVDVDKGQQWGMYSLDLEKVEVSWAGRPDIAETNPHVVLSLLRQLVNVAGVAEDNIYVGDPMKNCYKHCYELWHDEFPGVNYLGNELHYGITGLEAMGRTLVTESREDDVFYSDKGSVMPEAIKDRLYNISKEADYLINVPALKGHERAGITLSAKNHFGTHSRGSAEHLHAGLVPGEGPSTGGRNEYGHYRVQVDLMGHKDMGLNTLLIIVDGLYAGAEAVYPPDKWNSAPFNGGWASSLFVSQDQVALESVCFDFLRTEYAGKTVIDMGGNEVVVNFPNKCQGVDDYLHQAADRSNWPEGISYDPENDGIPIRSLGVHEHWNNATAKQYTGNLGQHGGIELFAPGLVNSLPRSSPEIGRTHYLHTNSKELVISSDIQAHYSDPEGSELSFTLGSEDEHINLSLDENNALRVRPATDFNGTATAGLIISDGTDTLRENMIFEVRNESDMTAWETEVKPVFDGSGDDAAWISADWYYLDQVWIPYRAEMTADDFSGRFKVSWSAEDSLLYFLAETFDDVFVDGYQHNPDPAKGGGYPNYDILEVFLDEDKSGGRHVFDKTGEDSENAFSHHMAITLPEDGATTGELVAADIAGNSWTNYIIADYAGHFVDFIVRRDGNRLVWEFSLKVYSDSYNHADPEQARAVIRKNKVLGLSLAYCDNDDPDETPKERDHFIGSDRGPDSGIDNWNDHWQNADPYGSLLLATDIPNRPPRALARNPSATMDPGGETAISLPVDMMFLDPDQDTLAYALETSTTFLTAEINSASNELVLTASAEFSGTAQVNVRASDGEYHADITFEVSSTSDIRTEQLKTGFQVIPDPYSSILTVRMQNELVGTLELSVVDIRGRLVSSHEFFKASHEFETSVPLSKHQPGVYLISVRQGQQMETLKIYIR